MVQGQLWGSAMGLGCSSSLRGAAPTPQDLIPGGLGRTLMAMRGQRPALCPGFHSTWGFGVGEGGCRGWGVPSQPSSLAATNLH